jgi:hypothetical protein
MKKLIIWIGPTCTYECHPLYSVPNQKSQAKAARGRRRREPGACVPAAITSSPALVEWGHRAGEAWRGRRGSRAHDGGKGSRAARQRRSSLGNRCRRRAAWRRRRHGRRSGEEGRGVSVKLWAIGHHANITDKNKLLPCTDRFLLVAIGFFMVLRVTELPAHSIFFYHVHMCSQFFLFLRLLCTNDNQTVLKMIQQFCTTFFDFEWTYRCISPFDSLIASESQFHLCRP